MGCTHPDELQARLITRSLWSRHNGSCDPSSSSLRRSLQAELDNELRESLSRRLERLGKVKSGSGCDIRGLDVQQDAIESCAPVADYSRLGKAVAKALQVGEPSKSASRSLAPSPQHLNLVFQSKKPQPSDKTEAIVDESETLQKTFASLMQSLSSRERQKKNLSKQLGACDDMCEAVVKELEATSERLRRLKQSKPESVTEVRQAYSDKVKRRRDRVHELSSNLKSARPQGQRYKEIANHQEAFLQQSEHLAMSGVPDALCASGRQYKHPAGEVFLVPPPQSLKDDDPHMWDVGSAIANPYVCDSWPFEPNVLAARTVKEASMPILLETAEEDESDEEDVSQHSEDQDGDEEAADQDSAPPETSRSV